MGQIVAIHAMRSNKQRYVKKNLFTVRVEENMHANKQQEK